MFINRKNAGQMLANVLLNYKDQNVLVLAITNGGIEVGYQVATYLDSDFSALITEELIHPLKTDQCIGAIAEDGSLFLVDNAMACLSVEDITAIVNDLKSSLSNRANQLRKNKPLPEVKDRTVILVDDGFDLCEKMRAAIIYCKRKNAKSVIVATPVCSKNGVEEMNKVAEELVVLKTPTFFQSVSQVYMNMKEITDQEAADILES